MFTNLQTQNVSFSKQFSYTPVDDNEINFFTNKPYLKKPGPREYF